VNPDELSDEDFVQYKKKEASIKAYNNIQSNLYKRNGQFLNAATTNLVRVALHHEDQKQRIEAIKLLSNTGVWKMMAENSGFVKEGKYEFKDEILIELLGNEDVAGTYTGSANSDDGILNVFRNVEMIEKAKGDDTSLSDDAILARARYNEESIGNAIAGLKNNPTTGSNNDVINFDFAYNAAKENKLLKTDENGVLETPYDYLARLNASGGELGVNTLVPFSDEQKKDARENISPEVLDKIYSQLAIHQGKFPNMKEKTTDLYVKKIIKDVFTGDNAAGYTGIEVNADDLIESTDPDVVKGYINRTSIVKNSIEDNYAIGNSIGYIEQNIKSLLKQAYPNNFKTNSWDSQVGTGGQIKLMKVPSGEADLYEILWVDPLTGATTTAMYEGEPLEINVRELHRQQLEDSK